MPELQRDHSSPGVCMKCGALWVRRDLLLRSSEVMVVYMWFFWKWYERAVWSAETTNVSCHSCPARGVGADRTFCYLGVEELACFVLTRVHTSLSTFPFRQCYLQPWFQYWPLVLVVVKKQNRTKNPTFLYNVENNTECVTVATSVSLHRLSLRPVWRGALRTLGPLFRD